jgi:spermidine synthase
MVVSAKDGRRRHLVGAGIRADNDLPSGRLGLEEHILEELQQQDSQESALECLAHHDFYPVYDAGVERLLLLVPKDYKQPTQSALHLWQKSIPTYASHYYSSNNGIQALLEHANKSAHRMDQRFSTDSGEAQKAIVDWKSTRGTAKEASLLFSAPSSLDPLATVEVRQRPGGWCTLGIVGGRRKSIYHGIYKMQESKLLDPSILISEHLRSMAAVALANLEGKETSNPVSFLYFGYGAGVLPRFMGFTIPRSQHVSVELDLGVVQASQYCGLLGDPAWNQTILHGDALTYSRPANQQPFDCLFVDIFDGDNLLPREFYHPSFLEKVRQNLLCPRHGMVVHNFHSGNLHLQAQLKEAAHAYNQVFPSVVLVDSLDSRPNAGNTILLATSDTIEVLRPAGLQARVQWDVNFDLALRATHHLRHAAGKSSSVA